MNIDTKKDLKDSIINLLVFNENGTCLVHKEPYNSILDASFKGIIQALFYTSDEFSFDIKTISTDEGVITYKKYEHKESSILVCLIFPNNFGDENLLDTCMDNLFKFLYHALLMHIGYYDLFHVNTNIEIEKIKKFFEIYNHTVEYILGNYSNPSILLTSEQRVDVNKDSNYSIKNYMDTIKQEVNQDFMALYFNNGLIWNTNEWLILNPIDRILFSIISTLYHSQDISEIPVYFSATVMENNATGIVPFKLIVIEITYGVKLICVSDTNYKLSNILEAFKNKFDEFFLSRLNNLKIQNVFENELINTTCSSIMIVNTIDKSYKCLLDTTKSDLLNNTIINCNFSNNVIQVISQNLGNSTEIQTDDPSYSEEFYMKTNFYIFYFLQLQNLFIFVLFPPTTSVNQINEVKAVLQNMKSRVELNKII